MTSTPYRLASPPARPSAPSLPPWRRATESALNVYVAVLPPLAAAGAPGAGWRPGHGEAVIVLLAALAWLARILWAVGVLPAPRRG